MKKCFWVLLFISFMCVLKVKGQVVIYKTYDDFLNSKGENYDSYEYEDAFSAPGIITLIFKGNDKKLRINPKNIWGFTQKTDLYRIFDGKHPVWAEFKGKKIIYYSNGYEHMHPYHRALEQEGYCFLSKDLSADIIKIPSRKKKYDAFVKENPEYKSLFDCVNQKCKYPTIKSYYLSRDCAQEFEAQFEDKK
ncbi:MAG: hypothetical protein V4565_04120 [Bacteroidota bacterium]